MLVLLNTSVTEKKKSLEVFRELQGQVGPVDVHEQDEQHPGGAAGDLEPGKEEDIEYLVGSLGLVPLPDEEEA